ncbi:hypothetical protein Tco_0126643 [Tanacetum coccineum]
MTEQDWSKVERTQDLVEYVYDKYENIPVTDEMLDDLYNFTMMKGDLARAIKAKQAEHDLDDVDLVDALDLENRIKKLEEDFKVVQISSYEGFSDDEDVVCINDVKYPFTDAEIRMFKERPTTSKAPKASTSTRSRAPIASTFSAQAASTSPPKDEIVDKMVDRLSKWKMIKPLSIGGVYPSQGGSSYSWAKMGKIGSRSRLVTSPIGEAFSGAWIYIEDKRKRSGTRSVDGFDDFTGVEGVVLVSRQIGCIWTLDGSVIVLGSSARKVIDDIRFESWGICLGVKSYGMRLWITMVEHRLSKWKMIKPLSIGGVYPSQGGSSYSWAKMGKIGSRSRLVTSPIGEAFSGAWIYIEDKRKRSGTRSVDGFDDFTGVEGVVLVSRQIGCIWTLDGSVIVLGSSARKVIDDIRFPGSVYTNSDE